MTSKCFLTEGEREMMKMACQEVEETPLSALPSSVTGPKSPGQYMSMLSKYSNRVKALGGGGAVGGVGGKHMRKTHLGKHMLERRGGGSIHLTVDEVKEKIPDLLKEYVEGGDTSEACQCIRQLGVPFFHHEVVKRALILAMKIHTAEPLIMKLLKEASDEGLISSSQITKGFTRVSECLADLALDIPYTKEMYNTLVTKAMSEGWLDSSYEKLEKSDEILKRYEEQFASIIHEYFLSSDIPKLIQRLVGLDMYDYNPVFLKKLITVAMDRGNREKELASVLLPTLHEEIFNVHEMVNGFVMLLESAEDTVLDILDASNELAFFLARVVIDGVLDPLRLEKICNSFPEYSSGWETAKMAQMLIASPHARERILRCWDGETVKDVKVKIQKLHEVYESDGAGDKGIWGKLIDTCGDGCLDRNDPNYGEEPYDLVVTPAPEPLDEYMKTVTSLVEEYFTTGDVEVAVSDLKELQYSEYHPYFIKRLISMAVDRNNKEKEKTLVLLSSLYVDVVNASHISRGFLMLLESADDLIVDILDAVDSLALLIAWAVVGNILPPAFVPRARKMLPESSKGYEVLQTAEKRYLSAPHHAELLERRGGGSIHLTVDEVKEKIPDLLKEYVEGGDTSEACQCIRQLGVPFFHHEVVKRALILAMKIHTAEPLIMKLLKEASDEGLISSSQITKGFTRVSECLADLALDIPYMKEMYNTLVTKAMSEGWLDSSYEKLEQSDEILKRYEEQFASIIHEYFLSSDIPKLIQRLVGLDMYDYNPVFLKKLITVAMDRGNREKELASVLLPTLHEEMFYVNEMVDGFVMLLESAEDTVLDFLDASNELAFFLARVVIDGVLDPVTLEKMFNLLPEYSSGRETAKMAQMIIASPHGRERILRCWDGETGWTVEDVKVKIQKFH